MFTFFKFLVASLVLLMGGVAFAADALPTGVKASGRDFTMIDMVVLAFGGALVFIMQAGFAFLEAGATRSKNAVNVLLKNYFDISIGMIGFWAVGYALMFGNNLTGWFGTDMFFFQPLLDGDYMFFFFQSMFAATAATIVSGAIAERAKYVGYLVGSVIITSFIYPLYGSWVWGGWHGGQGWLAKMGYIDFAGSSVVHMVGGFCSLAALWVVKSRTGRFTALGEVSEIPGHSIALTTLGAFLLWFGWFGFNGASIAVTGVDGSFGRILVNTMLAGCTGVIGSMIAMRLGQQKTMLMVTLNGGIAGLVAITAGCQVMDPLWAMVTGLVAGILVRLIEVTMLHRFKIDDVVGAVSVHAGGGTWGILAAGLFHKDHLFGLDQITVQLIGIGTAIAFVLPTAFIMYKIIDTIWGMRVTTLEEQRGLDIAEHAEIGYPEFQTVYKGNDE